MCPSLFTYNVVVETLKKILSEKWEDTADQIDREKTQIEHDRFTPTSVLSLTIQWVRFSKNQFPQTNKYKWT